MRETRIYISVTLEVKRFTERKNIALSIPPKCKLHATDVTRKGVAWITDPSYQAKKFTHKNATGRWTGLSYLSLSVSTTAPAQWTIFFNFIALTRTSEHKTYQCGSATPADQGKVNSKIT